MRYESSKTARGNVGVSYTSQQAAEDQAAQMDAANCTYCTNCMDCTYCTNCTNCTNCMDCTYCTGCTNCTGCTDCTGCTNCTGCTVCMEQPLQLIGLRWVVTVRKDKTIRIGCQDHSLAFWQRASDETIAAMDAEAPAFWAAHKAAILALAGVLA